MSENVDFFLVGLTFLFIGGTTWYSRKSEDGRFPNKFEAIAPGVTFLGAVAVLLGLLDSMFHILP